MIYYKDADGDIFEADAGLEGYQLANEAEIFVYQMTLGGESKGAEAVEIMNQKYPPETRESMIAAGLEQAKKAITGENVDQDVIDSLEEMRSLEQSMRAEISQKGPYADLEQFR